MQVVDYKPAIVNPVLKPNVIQPIKNEIIVDTLTGVKTQTINDTKVIRESQ